MPLPQDPKTLYGPYTVASYNNGFPTDGVFYKNAVISYPLDSAKPCPCVVLIYGFGGSQESAFEVWRPLLVSNGYTVVEFDPAIGSYGGPGYVNDPIIPPLRALGAEALLNVFRGENERADSPLFNKIDLSRTAVLGHSWGGCAALLAAANFDTVVALSPCNALPFDEKIFGKGIDRLRFPMLFGSYANSGNARCLLMSGDRDTIAIPKEAELQWQSLPPLNRRAIGMYKEADHVTCLLRRLADGDATEYNMAQLALEWLSKRKTTPAYPSLMSRWTLIEPPLNTQQTTILVAVLGSAVLLALGIALTVYLVRKKGKASSL